MSVCRKVSARVSLKDKGRRRRAGIVLAPSELCQGLPPSAPAERLAQASDLRGVVVRVVGVDAEPVLRGVAARLGVRAGARPVGVGHLVEELCARGARAAQGVERRPDRALVVAQAAGVVLLVVALYLRVLLGEEFAEAYGAVHLAVGEVLNYLARAPLAGQRVLGERLLG